MSLINEALKKAQKQRTGESAPLPAIGGESAERIARRAKPAGLNTLLLRLGIGGALLALVLIGGVFLLKKTPSAPTSTTVATAPTVKPAETASQPAPTVPSAAPTVPASTPAATFVIPVVATPTPAAPPKTESPAPVATTEAPKPVATAAPVTVATVAPVVAPVPPVPEPVKSPAPPGKLEPRAINFIESLRVAGIRASATDSKVLMNDRVYRLGSIVEHEMGLKLTGITSNSLTFEDEHGGTYTRTF